MSKAGVTRVNLNNITEVSENILIVGIIIAKRSPRSISRRDGRESGVWGFTFRDSPADYINVTVWGSPLYVTNLGQLYGIGDVIDITNPRINLRKASDREDKFQPPVSSCYELALSEDRSEICLHDQEDMVEFKKLLYIPTKPLSNVLTLVDINTNPKCLAGHFVNLLVVVQRVLDPREIVTKDGRVIKMFEMFVMDYTDSGFYIQSWNEETIIRSQSWKPKATVLFLSDAKVEWDFFKKRMKGSLVDRSIVTENPRTKEASCLSEFVKNTTVALPDISAVSSAYPHPDSITNVMSCRSIIEKSVGSVDDFTAVVFATLTSFDFDSESTVVSKCSECGRTTDTVCTNDDCPFSRERSKVTASFELKLKITDHTGTLPFCRLASRTAEKTLSVSVEEFMFMEELEKLNFKWKYLLKPIEVKLLIRPSDSCKLPSISVIDIKTVPVSEFVLKIPVM